MPTDEQVFDVLRRYLPNLEDGHFHIIKQTNHPYWEQAVQIAMTEQEDCPELAGDGSNYDF